LQKDFGITLEPNATRLPGVEMAVSRALGDFFAKSEDVKSGLVGIPYVHEDVSSIGY
tara:strand:- start:410 stop:580 length:171 start_codon:yes stop_codon:yes gene_type:complete